MNSLKSLRLRLKSVKTTQKMTAAMKMIAVARLKPARQRAEASLSYMKEVEHFLGVVRVGEENLAFHDPFMGGEPLGEEGIIPTWIPLQEGDRSHGHRIHLLIVITSDRGLCGPFNSNALKKAKEWVSYHRSHGNPFRLICLGRKGFDYFKGDVGSYILKNYEQLTYSNSQECLKRVQEIGQDIRTLFLEKAFDVADILYTEFHNIIQQSAQIFPFLPLNRIHLEDSLLEEARKVIYTYEPSLKNFLGPFIHHVMETFLYNGLLQSQVSEQAARMQAMDAATRNAKDMIEELTLTYNYTRQGLITKELMEIISGAESLKNMS